MKAQWQLIDVETGDQLMALGKPFDIDFGELKKKMIGGYAGTKNAIPIRLKPSEFVYGKGGRKK